MKVGQAMRFLSLEYAAGMRADNDVPRWLGSYRQLQRPHWRRWQQAGGGGINGHLHGTAIGCDKPFLFRATDAIAGASFLGLLSEFGRERQSSEHLNSVGAWPVGLVSYGSGRQRCQDAVPTMTATTVMK